MLNHQLGHDRGHDSSNSRNYNNSYGGANQNQGVFPVGGNLSGLHNMGSSYALQNSLPQSRGLGNLTSNSSQGQQSRYGGQGLPGNLQQYSQVANRTGLPLANGLTNQGLNNRGNPGNTGKQGQRLQNSVMSGLGGLNQNMQRSNTQGIGGINNLNQRNLQNIGLGGSQYIHHLNSPSRSNTLGLNNYGNANGPNSHGNSSQAPSELLSIIGKGNNQGPLGGLGGLSQAYNQAQHQQQAGSVQSNTGGSQASTQERDLQQPPSFDASEFPALGGGSRTANSKFANGDKPSSLEGANLYSNLGIRGHGMLSPEFNIQSEEFPALPGSATNGRANNEERQAGDQTAQLANLHPEQAARQDWSRGTDLSVPFSQNQEPQNRFSQNNNANVVQSSPVPSQGSRQQPNLRRLNRRQEEHDRFGLMGLMGVINSQDPDLRILAVGTDLTLLGLPLNSAELVYKTFANPWADNPIRAEPTFKVPECYRKPAPKLKAGYFTKFQNETLFYIFYSMPGDEAQVFAADELCTRNWGFHKEIKMWLRRSKGTEPIMKTAQTERGTFDIWDTNTWSEIRKDMVLHYELIERPPSLKRSS